MTRESHFKVFILERLKLLLTKKPVFLIAKNWKQSFCPSMVHLGMDKQTIDIVCYSSTARMNLTGTKLSGKKTVSKH